MQDCLNKIQKLVKNIKLRNLPADWNMRVFTESDFDNLSFAAGVRVFESEMKIEGAYCVYDGSPVIFINRALPWPRKLFVKFHELGHHWLHYPGVQFFLNTHSKVELEANIVAVCSLVPFPLLRDRDLWEIGQEYGYNWSLLKFRAEVFEKWGL